MDQKSTYMQRISNVAWKLLKYVRRLALTACVLFTAVFWIAWAIALSQGLIYRFQFWKFGIKMTLITLAAVVAAVLWHFFDMRRVGILTAFCTFEATLALLYPMFDLYYRGVNLKMITYHITDEGDYGTIKLAHITDPSRVYEAKTEAVFFWRILNWETENNKYALGKKYRRDFSEIACNDGITRYMSTSYPKVPEVKARVYDNRNWRKGDIVDDYIQKLERYLVLQCYKEEGMTWEYVLGKNDDLREGEIYFVIKEDDDLVQYSKDISKMIDATLSETLFNRFEGSITVKYETKDTTDGGVPSNLAGMFLSSRNITQTGGMFLRFLKTGCKIFLGSIKISINKILL